MPFASFLFPSPPAHVARRGNRFSQVVVDGEHLKYANTLEMTELQSKMECVLEFMEKPAQCGPNRYPCLQQHPQAARAKRRSATRNA